MAMNPEVKAQWVTALRSGDYAQGNGYLHTNALAPQGDTNERVDEYCCLGVLCDLAVKAGVEMELSQSPGQEEIRYNGEGALLPDAVMDWAGLNDWPDPHVICDNDGDTYNGEPVALSELNDNHESFNTIAGLIEAQL